MADIEDGAAPLTLARAAREECICRNGRAPSPATIYRWHSAGVGRVKLETARVGGSLVTTRAALIRFIRRLSEPTAAADVATPRQARRCHEEAERALDAAGIC